MRMLTIPGSDLSVSSLCLGIADYGTRISEEESFRLLDQFVEGGGNFLDTAHVYAAWIPGGWGTPERVIGKWLKARGNLSSIVVATKGAHPNFESMHISRCSREEILQDLDESLERLQMEQVPLYWLHRDDPTRSIEEIVETLQIAISSKKIRYFGVSNWSTSRIKEMRDYTEAHNLTGFVGNQVGWSLAARNANVGGDTTIRFMDAEMEAYHQQTGLFVAAYSSQANGFFGGNYGRDIPHPTPKSAELVVRSYYSERNFGRLERVQELATQHNCHPNSIALAYLTSQPYAVSAIASCPTSEYLATTLEAGSLRLSHEEVSYLVQG